MDCAVCGTAFEARRSDARYCSHRCQVAGQRAGNRVHFARAGARPDSETGTPVADPERATEASARRPRPLVVPEVEPCRSPVYAHGSLHGPVYDAKGNQLRSPIPSVVGYLTPDGRFERERTRRAAEGAA